MDFIISLLLYKNLIKSINFKIIFIIINYYYEVDHVYRGADCYTCAKRLIARKLLGKSPLNIIHVAA